MSYFSDKLRELREASGLTQADLAQRLGISKSSVSMYERGDRQPDIQTLERIGAILQVDMNELLGSGEVPALNSVYLALAKDMQRNKIDPEDIRRLIGLVRKVRGDDEG